MRWIVAALVLAACAAPQPLVQVPPDVMARLRASSDAEARPLQSAASQGPRAVRDARTQQEAILAAQSGQPLVPIIQRHAEENVRDGVAIVPLGRNRPDQAIHSERARLMGLAMAAIESMNARTTATMASATEQGSRAAYCRSLAGDIAGVVSSDTDLVVRALGIPTTRESSLYRSCMASFGRSDDYLGR